MIKRVDCVQGQSPEIKRAEIVKMVKRVLPKFRRASPKTGGKLSGWFIGNTMES